MKQNMGLLKQDKNRFHRVILMLLIVSLCLMSFKGMTYASVDYGDTDKAKAYLLETGMDEWGLLALYALGEDVSQFDLEEITSKTTTDYEAYILGAGAKGIDLSKAATTIKNTQLPSGKFADEIGKKGEDLVNAHIWGIISLYVAGVEDYNKKTALKWLSDHQNKDGGFPVYAGDDYSDLDLTGMAIIAYSLLGLSESDTRIKDAFDFIEKNMDYEETCEALAWAIIAQKFIGQEVKGEYIERLLEYRLEDGTYKHLKSIKKNNYIATYSGLLAMNEYDNECSVLRKLHSINRFSDLTVKTKYIEAITYLLEEGILAGYEDDTFRPINLVKRAEFAKMLVYGMGIEDEVDSRNQFTDMKGHWAEGIATLAFRKGIINGTGNNHFAPEATIKGAEVAAIVVRVNKLEDEAKKVEGKNWYDGYVKIALDQGLLYEDFQAEKNATRGQCAEVIKSLTLGSN